ncbi:amino acid ABC transporter permease [Aquibaculum sediminis]|uniref:amino acid ABC transporter permease n=1 Tax=Aquibaculum sediminis TaxID=3231907 RepID=UPI0034514F02
MTDQTLNRTVQQAARAGGDSPIVQPPTTKTGVIGWLRANLFSTWYNSLATLILLYILAKIIPGIVDWLFISAVWTHTEPEVCRAADGACWAFIHEKYRLILFGTYPFDEQWRPTLAVLLYLVLLLASCNRAFWKPWLGVAWVAMLAVIGTLMYGGVFGLTQVPTTRWGGLPLTLMLASFALAIGFPLGILMALGRRSNLPIVRILSVAYIELIRGVPLITVLFMASVMLPLFLPQGVSINNLLRAQIGIILFASAYLAEVVRGGLQAIPKGQYEAADSIGLGYWQKTRLIILPQALRISIPPLVNTFIGLFKDTSLVIIVGLFDLVGAAKAALTDPSWRGFYRESYFFIAMIYFVFCFSMSKYSQYLEKRLNVGTRR